jgi:O-antigen ligase
VTLVAGLAGFLFVFRKDFGTVRVIQLFTIAAALLVVASVIVVEFTGFNLMFERLSGATETVGGVPLTRQFVWPEAWQRFLEVPWFGQGPMWKLPDEDFGLVYPGHVYFDYPHSLYLYLLVTVGITGTITFFVFFLLLGLRYLRAARETSSASPYLHGLVRLGPLLLLLFLLDEIRIEFLRPVFSDYQHVVFGLFGLWLGLGQRDQASGQSTDS